MKTYQPCKSVLPFPSSGYSFGPVNKLVRSSSLCFTQRRPTW